MFNHYALIEQANKEYFGALDSSVSTMYVPYKTPSSALITCTAKIRLSCCTYSVGVHAIKLYVHGWKLSRC